MAGGTWRMRPGANAGGLSHRLGLAGQQNPILYGQLGGPPEQRTIRHMLGSVDASTYVLL